MVVPAGTGKETSSTSELMIGVPPNLAMTDCDVVSLRVHGVVPVQAAPHETNVNADDVDVAVSVTSEAGGNEKVQEGTEQVCDAGTPSVFVVTVTVP